MSARDPHLAPYWLSLPSLLFIGLLYLVPVAFLMMLSFVKADPGGTRIFTLATYAELFADSYNLGMIWRTVQISAVTTICSLVLAFPVALYMRQVSPVLRAVITFILLSPLLTSVVVRTLAWVILLGPKGVINSGLVAVGLNPVALIYNQTGVIIGLTHVFFGYMALSIMVSVLKIDESLLLAASNLGASRWTILREIILPLCLPGILSGSVLVFTMSASTYATPVLLGGSATKMVATEIYDTAVNYLDWNTAAALSCVLFLGIATLVLLAGYLSERGRGRAIFG
jgi:putative spermidine/putrescine transport system permease protein